MEENLKQEKHNFKEINELELEDTKSFSKPEKKTNKDIESGVVESLTDQKTLKHKNDNLCNEGVLVAIKNALAPADDKPVCCHQNCGRAPEFSCEEIFNGFMGCGNLVCKDHVHLISKSVFPSRRHHTTGKRKKKNMGDFKTCGESACR